MDPITDEERVMFVIDRIRALRNWRVRTGGNLKQSVEAFQTMMVPRPETVHCPVCGSSEMLRSDSRILVDPIFGWKGEMECTFSGCGKFEIRLK